MYNNVQSVDYFIYNGISYAAGTEIKLVDEIYLQHRSLKPGNNYKVIFQKMHMSNGELLCLIEGLHCIFIPSVNYIQEITKPIYYIEPDPIKSAIDNYLTGKKKPDVFYGWVWYLLIIMFLFICQNGWLYIIVATIFFAGWLISKYKD